MTGFRSIDRQTRALANRTAARQDESGFFTLWVLGLCVCILFMGGLSLDLWRGFGERRELAAMADAAAIAGASHLDLQAFRESPSVVTLDETEAKRAALQYLQNAAADAGITLTTANVGVVNGELRVRVATNIDLTLTKLLRPNDSLQVSVGSAAEPRVAS